MPEGLVTEDLLHKALDLVQIKHPRLQCRIIQKQQEFFFEDSALCKIPLNVYSVDSYRNLPDAINRELNTGINSSQILLRAAWVTNEGEKDSSYLLITASHTVMDATCGMRLVADILSYCDRLTSKDLVTPKTLAVPASLDFYSRRNLKETLKENSSQYDQIDCLIPQYVVPHIERRCKVITHQFNSHTSKAIIYLCKQQRVSVHGLLCAAMMLSVVKHLNNVEQQSLNISCRSAVDMRRRVRPTIEDSDVSAYVSALTSLHTISSKTSLWQLAGEVTSQIRERLKTSEIYDTISGYKQSAEYLLKHPEVVPFSTYVSNLGQVRIPSNYGNFKLESIHYALSNTVMNSAFSVAVSTFEGQMTLNFLGTLPSLKPELLDSLIKECLSQIKLQMNGLEISQKGELDCSKLCFQSNSFNR